MIYRTLHMLIGLTVLFLVTLAFMVASYPYSRVIAIGLCVYVSFALVLFTFSIVPETEIVLPWQEVIIIALKTPWWLIRFTVAGK